MTVLDNTTAPTPTPTTPDVAGVDPVQFATRLIVDAIQEATADYWERRANTFDWICGHTDHPRHTPICRRSADTAQACRNAAALARMPETTP